MQAPNQRPLIHSKLRIIAFAFLVFLLGISTVPAYGVEHGNQAPSRIKKPLSGCDGTSYYYRYSGGSPLQDMYMWEGIVCDSGGGQTDIWL